MSNEILFISDLHLDQSKPEISQHFLTFIKTRATHARVLYILGDLFESWSGDDDPAEQFNTIFKALQNLAKSTQIYFLHGNRDFLVGQQLAQKIGFKIIPSATVIELSSQKVALLHGDELCTDDVEYQKFRTMVRDHQWQQNFLAKSLNERLAIAAQLRTQSHAAMQHKSIAIMDVNQQTVTDTFERLNVNTIIHGHTHRPAVHLLEQDRRRFVLGDWNPQPSYINWSNGELKLKDVRI